jgi:NAD(P)-dependent dehydrogenase (short-subunit alcohol dehydrogenase family)
LHSGTIKKLVLITVFKEGNIFHLPVYAGDPLSGDSLPYPILSLHCIPIHASMAEPLILVTGSTDGIGKATATALVKGGAEVILHGRDEKKGKRVQRELETTTGGHHDLLIADYSRQDQIRIMASDIIARYARLDVLINNVGTYQKTRHVTREGTEMTFAVNYLGPFLLTTLLLPLLKKNPGARIVTVASSAHEDVDRINWDELPQGRRYDPWGAYALSKFADITFTYTLARNLEGSGVTANCLHPGVVDTKLLRSAFPGYPAIRPEEAAKMPVWLARSPEVAGVSGKYFDAMRPARSSSLAYDQRVQERLWKMAEELTGISREGV